MFSPKYILILTAVILLFSGLVYIKQSDVFLNSAPLASESPSSSPLPDFVNFKIKDNISYKLPEAWKSMKEYMSSANYTNQQGSFVPYIHNITYAYESDYQRSKTESIRLSIEVSNKTVKEYLDINQYKDGEMFEIDGKSAVKGHYDDSSQGHFLEYRFIHKDLPWKIWIQTPNLEAEKKYQEEIDSFINSIDLKD